MPYAALDALSRGCEWEYVDAIFSTKSGTRDCDCRERVSGFREARKASERERDGETEGIVTVLG